jgi:hypothetical protein
MAKKTDAPAAKPGTSAWAGRARHRRRGPRAAAAARMSSGELADRLSALRQMCSLDCYSILLCSVFLLLCARCVLVLLRSALLPLPPPPSARTAAAAPSFAAALSTGRHFRLGCDRIGLRWLLRMVCALDRWCELCDDDALLRSVLLESTPRRCAAIPPAAVRSSVGPLRRCCDPLALSACVLTRLSSRCQEGCCP